MTSGPEGRAAELAVRLAALEERLAAACAAAGRERAEVTLVAVGKTWPASDIGALHAAGVRDFGENRDQEAAPKAAQLSALDGLRWHFVGGLQRNKTRSVARYAALVHTLDRVEVVDALAAGARRAGRAVPALVQVSLDGDPGRGGAVPADVPRVADRVAAADGLELAGVMAVAPLGADPLAAFERLATVAERVRADHPAARTVSAGMSGDLEAAIATGATLVRVGTALFGGRPPILG